MDTVIFVMVSLSLLICAFDFGVTIVSNIKFRPRMRLGGKYTLLLADTTLLCTVGALVMNIFFVVQAYEHRLELTSALFCVFAQLTMFLLLLARRNQNLGMSMMIRRGDMIKDNRSRMLAKISHEIRTPMNTIVGLTEVISRRPDISEEVRDNLQNISSASTSLLTVVNNLIDFSKIESDRLELFEYDYNTKDLVLTLIQRTENMLKTSGVEFIAQVDENLPSVLHGDDVRIIQAISNILSNACKYTRVGIITLKIYGGLAANKCKLTFEIEDTGIGIDSQMQENLFSLTEGKKEITPISNDSVDSSGAGLGLLITKSIVDKLEGNISISSANEVGTDFKVEFSQTIIDAKPIGAIKTNSDHTKDKHYMFTAPMSRILVVDDNIVNLFVAKELLSNYGIDIQTATSGAECLQLVNENYYDIIFMDYVMPNMDGHETLNNIRLKKNDHLKTVPVIALTAQIITGSDRMFIEEGFQGYLSKPIDVAELEEILLKYLPEEYICYKDVVRNETLNDDVEDKPWYQRFCSVLEDIDVKKGLTYCNNDYSSYLNLLRTIYNDSFTTTTKLKGSVDSADMEEYRIAVHAMKSVCASAGNERLSQICAEHEKAAKADDFEYINTHSDELTKEYDMFLRKIETLLQRESEMMNKGYSAPRMDKNESEIFEIALKLVSAIEDYNIDDSEQYLMELEKINLPLDKEKLLLNVKDSLLLFKYDEASEMVKSGFGI